MARWKTFVFLGLLIGVFVAFELSWSTEPCRAIVGKRGGSRSGCQIINQNYSRISIKSLSLADVEIENSHFANAILAESRWLSVTAKNIDFSHLNARSLQIIRSRLDGSSFRNADLQGMKLDQSSCQGCDFSGADLRGAFIVGSILNEAVFDSKTKLPFSEEAARRFGMRLTSDLRGSADQGDESAGNLPTSVSIEDEDADTLEKNQESK